MADEPSTSGIRFVEVVDVDEKSRTADVYTDGSFNSFILSAHVIQNLARAGFKKPSPIQERAIPNGMAGFDLLVQAKSGTGKTLVFSVLAVEHLNLQNRVVQKLILAPTREIATQIADTVKRLAPNYARIAVFTGGTPVAEDRNRLKQEVHIVIGTTGRLCQLVQEESLHLQNVNLFVLDEADKMMSDNFEKDVNFLFSALPSSKQVCVFSATYPSKLEVTLGQYMREAKHIRLNADDVQLIGIKQYVIIPRSNDPLDVAVSVFKKVMFNQALIFCAKSEECANVCSRLKREGFEAASISAKLEQTERDDVMKRLKSCQIKIMVSTDLTARGIDAENVNLVVNLEPAFDTETYLHRIGRAARYGGYGASVTILCGTRSVSRFCHTVRDGSIRARILRLDEIPNDLPLNQHFYEECAPFVVEERFQKEKRGALDILIDQVMGNDDHKEDENKSIKEEKREERDDKENVEGVATRDDDNENEPPPPDYNEKLRDVIEISNTLNKQTPAGNAEKAPPKKAKFVPSRLKNKMKYYMKGEMVAIRDTATPEQWKSYARQKFDLSLEPFLDAPVESPPPQQKKKHSKKSVQETETVDDERNLNVKTYTRKDMIAISKSKPYKVWREYTLARWDTTEDPFVMESWKRCSYQEQIRKQREREKMERNKVIRERNEQRELADKLVSTGTTVCHPEYAFHSFHQFSQYLMDKQIGEGPRRGPVVARRDSPSEYAHRVQAAKQWLTGFENNFKYLLSLSMGKIKEIAVGPDEEEEREAEFEETQKKTNQIDMKVQDEVEEEEEVYDEEEEEEYYDEDEEWEEEEYWQEGEEENEGGEGDEGGEGGEEGGDTVDEVCLFRSACDRNVLFYSAYSAYLTCTAGPP